MSDNPCKVQQIMERVFLCNDIWFDCLPWLSRAKVGLAFALVSDRFDGLADAHLNSRKRPWTLGKLKIKRRQGQTIIYNWDTKKLLPFPDEPLPENVIGFKRIDIYYIDQNVIAFLRRIRRLFQPKNNGNNDGIGLELHIFSSQVYNLGVFFDSIRPLIITSAITKLCLPYSDVVDVFRNYISPTFLLDLANLRVVDVNFFENEENDQLLRQWLLTPREDGKPKLLKHYAVLNSQMVDELKMAFLSAQIAVSFIITLRCLGAAVPFEVDNLCTGERLAFRKVKDKIDGIDWLLERGPILGRNVEQWTKWAREAMDTEMEEHNLLTLSFNDHIIGLLDEIAGPSGQSQQKRIKLDEK